MEKSIFEVLLQYGLSGVILGVAGWYIWKKDQAADARLDKKQELHTSEIIAMQEGHKAERKELVETLTRQHREALDVTQKVTIALTEVSTMIRSQPPR